MVFTDLLDNVASQRISGGGGAAAPLPSAADVGRGRRAVAATGRASNRATPTNCTMCWWRAICWTAGRKCCAAWNGRAFWCWTRLPEKLTIDAVNRYLALKTGMRM